MPDVIMLKKKDFIVPAVTAIIFIFACKTGIIQPHIA